MLQFASNVEDKHKKVLRRINSGGLNEPEKFKVVRN